MSQVHYEGWMRKKGAIVNIWGERYFILRGHTLNYYLRRDDSTPKGFFTLLSTCRVSDITSAPARVTSGNKNRYVFRISWPPPQGRQDNVESKMSSRTRDWFGWLNRGTKTNPQAPTDAASKAGIASPNTGAESSTSDSGRYIELAVNTYHDAQQWVHAIECQIAELQSKGITQSNSASNLNEISSGSALSDDQLQRDQPDRRRFHPAPGVRIREVETWIRTTKWDSHKVVHGMRLLKPSLERNSSQGSRKSWADQIYGAHHSSEVLPCLRVNITLNGSPEQTLQSLLDMSSFAGPIKSIRVVEQLEQYLDVIHVVLESMELFPTRTAPRDLCLMRYWRQNEDGSYLVCLDTTTHQDCPVVEGYVRAVLHAAYVISGLKDQPKGSDFSETSTKIKSKGQENEEVSNDKQVGENTSYEDECLISLVAQLDPRGWIWTQGGYRDRVLERFMEHILDLKDNIDRDRFETVTFDAEEYEHEEKENTTTSDEKEPVDATPTPVTEEEEEHSGERVWMGNTPPSQCPEHMWGEPDASTFKVRGHNYIKDGKKIPSAPSLFKLIAIDLLDTGKAMKNVCSHPRNRVCQALKRGEDTFVFVMNIMIPGPPWLSFIGYWQADKKLFDEDTPFGRLARPFFYGNDDNFRNNRFKLIPKIVAGNFLVKQAVPQNTPTLLGNKLNQYYYKGDNYFELDVDVGSSSVAKYTVGIAQSYSKTMHCDMGLCLQGNEESELPEVLFAGCSAINLDTSKATRL